MSENSLTSFCRIILPHLHSPIGTNGRKINISSKPTTLGQVKRMMPSETHLECSTSWNQYNHRNASSEFTAATARRSLLSTGSAVSTGSADASRGPSDTFWGIKRLTQKTSNWHMLGMGSQRKHSGHRWSVWNENSFLSNAETDSSYSPPPLKQVWHTIEIKFILP